jgi:hypothetical protein
LIERNNLVAFSRKRGHDMPPGKGQLGEAMDQEYQSLGLISFNAAHEEVICKVRGLDVAGLDAQGERERP